MTKTKSALTLTLLAACSSISFQANGHAHSSPSFYLVVPEGVELTEVSASEVASLYRRKSHDIRGFSVEPSHLPVNHYSRKEFTVKVLGYKSVLHEKERMSLMKWQNLATPPTEFESLEQIKATYRQTGTRHATYIPKNQVAGLPAGLKAIPIVHDSGT